MVGGDRRIHAVAGHEAVHGPVYEAPHKVQTYVPISTNKITMNAGITLSPGFSTRTSEKRDLGVVDPQDVREFEAPHHSP